MTCTVLSQLLKDWYLKALRALQASSNNTSGSRMAARTPEPGYVLLIHCPAAACAVVGRAAEKLEVDLSSSMTVLCELLQEALGSAWGSMPSAWRALVNKYSKEQCSEPAARKAPVPHQHTLQTGQIQALKHKPSSTAVRYSMCPDPPQQGQLQQSQLIPVHGLQMSSSTRSLAGMQVMTGWVTC